MNDRARQTGVDVLDDQVESDPVLRVSGVQARAARSHSSARELSAVRPLPLISIGSPAEPELLEPTYAYLSVYTSSWLSPRLAVRLNVAIYELYANALRYGSGAGEVRLVLERSPSGVGAKLSVTNSALPAELEKLRAQVSRVQADASLAFNCEMDRFAGGSLPAPMLGLVRVAHESTLELALQVDGDRITISTVCEP